MIIDCDECVMQHTAACDDCIVTALMDVSGPLEIDAEEKAAIESLSDAGLVAPLRLVRRDEASAAG